VVVHPGEVLFIPAMWLHQVTSASIDGHAGPSVSLAVFSSSRTSVLFDATLQLPLPVNQLDTAGALLQATAWLKLLLSSTQHTDLRGFVGGIINQRYSNAPREVIDAASDVTCPEESATKPAVTLGGVAGKSLHLWRQMERSAEREMYLGSHIELLSLELADGNVTRVLGVLQCLRRLLPASGS